MMDKLEFEEIHDDPMVQMIYCLSRKINEIIDKMAKKSETEEERIMDYIRKFYSGETDSTKTNSQ